MYNYIIDIIVIKIKIKNIFKNNVYFIIIYVRLDNIYLKKFY